MSADSPVPTKVRDTDFLWRPWWIGERLWSKLKESERGDVTRAAFTTSLLPATGFGLVGSFVAFQFSKWNHDVLQFNKNRVLLCARKVFLDQARAMKSAARVFVPAVVAGWVWSAPKIAVPDGYHASYKPALDGSPHSVPHWMDPVAWEYITYKEQAACDSCTKISETLPLFLATPIGVAAVSIGTRFVKNPILKFRPVFLTTTIALGIAYTVAPLFSTPLGVLICGPSGYLSSYLIPRFFNKTPHHGGRPDAYPHMPEKRGRV